MAYTDLNQARCFITFSVNIELILYYQKKCIKTNAKREFYCIINVFTH